MAVKKKLRIKKKVSGDGPKLPTKKKDVSAADSYTLFLYGPEGIGKTTFSSKAGDAPLFLVTEAGVKFVKTLDMEIPDWEAFIAAADLVYNKWKESPDNFPYTAVAVDTADNAFEFCQGYVCDKLGIDHPSDEEWGKGYQAVRVEFMRQLTKLALIGRPLILTSHEKTIEVKGRLVKTNKIVPTLPNTARRVILPMVDIIGHCGYKTGSDGEATTERVIDFSPTETVEAKDRTGLLPKHVELNFDSFMSYLSGDKVKPRGGVKSTRLPRIKRLGR